MKIWSKTVSAILLIIPIIALPYGTAVITSFQSGVEANDIISVFNNKQNEVVEMTAYDYLCGVVAAEMPALYEKEALKAQTVACYSYLLHRMDHADGEHENACVCTSSSHCTAYSDDDELKSKWGDDYEKYKAKIEEAVKEVFGKAITYKEKPIDALFFARSSGKTENSENVWSNSLPYLRSVDSSVDLSGTGLDATVTISVNDFKSKIKTEYPDADFSASLFSDIKRTEAGYVSSIICGSIEMTGKKFRSVFSLNSSDFTVSENNGEITVTTKGKGHGVGMSQYGANMMAKLGYGYEEILKHYYTGVEITEMTIFE